MDHVHSFTVLRLSGCPVVRLFGCPVVCPIRAGLSGDDFRSVFLLKVTKHKYSIHEAEFFSHKSSIILIYLIFFTVLRFSTHLFLGAF